MSTSASEWVELPHNMGCVRRSTRSSTVAISTYGAVRRKHEDRDETETNNAGSNRKPDSHAINGVELDNTDETETYNAGSNGKPDGHAINGFELDGNDLSREAVNNLPVLVTGPVFQRKRRTAPTATNKRSKRRQTVKSENNEASTENNVKIGANAGGDVWAEGDIVERNNAKSNVSMKQVSRSTALAPAPTSTSSASMSSMEGLASTSLRSTQTRTSLATVIETTTDATSTDWASQTLASLTETLSDAASTVQASTAPTNIGQKKQKIYKPSKYDYTPRHTPYPDHPKPSPEDCEEVYQLLLNLHAKDDTEGLKFQQPDEIPPPSLTHAGCGEVPDLLDGLLRTRLSAATMARNAAAAIQGLKEKFGFGTGIHEATINWEAVRQADVKVVEQAILAGGLAPKKSRDMKDILNNVYDGNTARRNELLKVRSTPAYNSDPTVRSEVDFKLDRLEHNMLSMDHILDMTTEEAMLAMMELPGIAVKTAACVVLFRMQRPSFAVDTHVQRLFSWLGWVPKECKSADKTFNHAQQRVPDHLKYPLHQLFLAHGKACLRCRADTSPSIEGYDECECPIEHLVVRTGKMKEKVKGAGAAESKNKKKKVEAEDDGAGREDEFEED